jgi:1-acyl-sn-glycerol-3-phosphate acyltransferase
MSPSVALRRTVLLPTVIVFEALLIVTSPLLFLAAAMASAASRSSRALRTARLVVAYARIELATLARIIRGVDDWDQLLVRVLDQAYDAMQRILKVPLVLDDASPDASEVGRTNGVIVLARHCGPGDSIYVAWLLAVHYHLALRVVLKNLLRLEPSIDLAAPHLGLCFVGGRAGTATFGITEVATALSQGDALLLFPEGRNFSVPRWESAIKQLRARGDYTAASRARRRTHTLPPHLGGALAALTAAPRADVLLLAHSGFSPNGRDRPWWRLPTHRTFAVRTVLIPAAQVPRDEERVRAFLDRAWSQVDTWVEGYTDLMAAGCKTATAEQVRRTPAG